MSQRQENIINIFINAPIDGEYEKVIGWKYGEYIGRDYFKYEERRPIYKVKSFDTHKVLYMYDTVMCRYDDTGYTFYFVNTRTSIKLTNKLFSILCMPFKVYVHREVFFVSHTSSNQYMEPFMEDYTGYTAIDLVTNLTKSENDMISYIRDSSTFDFRNRPPEKMSLAFAYWKQKRNVFLKENSVSEYPAS